MRISDVRVIKLHFNYEQDAGYMVPRGRATGGLIAFVEVTVDNGLKGIGPAYSHPDLLEQIVEHHFKPFLVGKDPALIEQHWDDLYRLAKWYGRRGVAVTAVGGVDNALWDIRGKVEGRPVYQLLGGTRDRLPAYASDLFWTNDHEALTRQACGFVEQGFRFVKMRAGLNPDFDRALVRAVKQGVGHAAQILVDGSQRYNLEEAIEFGHFLAQEGVYLFEEPFEPDEIDDYAALQAEISIPVAAGENETSFTGFRELFRNKCLGIAQPDVSRVGGITACWRVGQLAQEHDVGIITHTWSDAASIIANAHVVAALPNGIMVEVNRTNNPFIEQLLATPLALEDGQLLLPDAPGLGLEFNEETIDRCTLPPGQRVPIGHYSDLTFGREFDWSWDPYPMSELRERPAVRSDALFTTAGDDGE